MLELVSLRGTDYTDIILYRLVEFYYHFGENNNVSQLKFCVNVRTCSLSKKISISNIPRPLSEGIIEASPRRSKSYANKRPAVLTFMHGD